MDQLVANLDPWLMFLGLFGLFLVAVEGGFRVGRRQEAGITEKVRIEITTGEAAVLGLLALLLSFSFSMSGSRYEVQRGLVLEEANAIGTTYLRAKLLPEPHRTEVAGLLEDTLTSGWSFTRPAWIARSFGRRTTRRGNCTTGCGLRP